MLNSPFAWNDFYEKQEVYNPLEAMEPALEGVCEYLGKQGGVVLDFGCGNGRMALRILNGGARQVIGLDASYHGISLARRAGLKAFSSLQTKWLWGSVDSLAQIPDGHLKGCLLADILGLLEPVEVTKLGRYLERLLDDDAKVVVIETATDQDLKQRASSALQGLKSILGERLAFRSSEVLNLCEGRGPAEIQYGTYKHK